MPYYTLKFGLSSPVNQTQLVQALKSDGGDAIQASDGLHVKSQRAKEDFEAWLREEDFAEGMTFLEISRDKVLSDPEAAADLKAFVGA